MELRAAAHVPSRSPLAWSPHISPVPSLRAKERVVMSNKRPRPPTQSQKGKASSHNRTRKEVGVEPALRGTPGGQAAGRT